MRLLLLPISTRRALLYAQPAPTPPAAAAGAPPTPPKLSLLDRGAAKAGGVWAGWERAGGGWRARVVGWGNAAFARIPYPEWSLKRVPRRPPPPPAPPPPSLGAKGAGAGAGVVEQEQERVQVLYPGDLLAPARVLEEVGALGARAGFHRRWLGWSVVGMPLTLPCAAVPVIPNLPFLYLAFRAWSHWKALLGARHLDHLARHRLLDAQPSPRLQRLYDAPPLSPARLQALRERLRGTAEPRARQTAVLHAIEGRRKQRAGASASAAPAAANADAASAAAADTDAAGAAASAVSAAGRPPAEEMVAGDQTGPLVALYYDLPQLDGEMARARAQVQRLIAQEHAAAQGGEEGEK